ncbi:MAG: TetR/AcrR family transcriptional regulator [candidate division Zixibacteria bacterium]|nr:TetR/AcrR family transcriptional regulator [candidate division Zixibacteria bacterium]
MEKPTFKRKEREKEARREAILDAAVRLFSRKGNYDPTLDDIANEAELSKGTIYNYFKDKHYLIAALLLRCHEKVVERLREIVSRNETLSALIHAVLGSIKSAQDDKYIFHIFFSAGLQMPEELRLEVATQWRSQEQQAAQILADKLAVTPETSHLTPLQQLVGARMIMSAVHYSIVVTAGEVAFQPPAEELDTFARMLHRALTMEHA